MEFTLDRQQNLLDDADNQEDNNVPDLVHTKEPGELYYIYSGGNIPISFNCST